MQYVKAFGVGASQLPNVANVRCLISLPRNRHICDVNCKTSRRLIYSNTSANGPRLRFFPGLNWQTLHVPGNENSFLTKLSASSSLPGSLQGNIAGRS